jgi:hypothetical protein
MDKFEWQTPDIEHLGHAGQAQSGTSPEVDESIDVNSAPSGVG